MHRSPIDFSDRVVPSGSNREQLRCYSMHVTFVPVISVTVVCTSCNTTRAHTGKEWRIQRVISEGANNTVVGGIEY
ncbi:hypothetical protein J6590_080123 [Homalodisca vitripennis]|nr:hypothetical protein J6590_080123 [Homalodisca vitripennis]